MEYFHYVNNNFVIRIIAPNLQNIQLNKFLKILEEREDRVQPSH